MLVRSGVGSLKLYAYMKAHGVDEQVFEQFSNVLQGAASPKELAEMIQGMERKIDMYYPIPTIQYRIEKVFDLLGDNNIMWTVFEMAMLEYMDDSIDVLLEYLFPGHKKGIRLSEAFHITYPMDEYVDHMGEMLEAEALLPLILIKEFGNMELIDRHYKADSEIIAYLRGLNHEPEQLQSILTLIPSDNPMPEMIIYKDKLSEMMEFVEAFNENPLADYPVISIRGEKHMGKTFLAKHFAKAFDKELVIMDYKRYYTWPENDRELWRDEVMRKVWLHDAVLLIENVFMDNELDKMVLTDLFSGINPGTSAVVICSEEVVNISSMLIQPVHVINLEKCSYMENQKLWEKTLGLMVPDTKLNTYELADKLPLAPGIIFRVVQKIATMPKFYSDTRKVIPLCYEFLETSSMTNMKKVVTNYRIDDVKLDDVSRGLVNDICDRIENRMQVFDIGNMRKKYPYGRSVSVLFTGPPGTGKTMVASAIANEVGLELYRVDLSQMVDKYIGETEKRLELVFSQAEQSHCILFFDEADSIFGKRSELSDSKDKFANTQVSFLLQRIEEFDGIVIMASNYKDNIDKAFVRRINYIVDFHNPTEEIRRAIWESLLGEYEDESDIDFEFLAKRFEMSGAMIKNIVLKAVFIAVAKKETVGMEHIMKALMEEYRKVGRNISKEDLMEYSFLFE